MNEIKLQTPVDPGKGRVALSLKDRTMVLGSCFSDSIGRRMSETGFDVSVNPFGTIYNPVSICNSIARLSSGVPFTAKDCVKMGAGADLFCSFSHHTSFARRTPEEFLEAANSELVKSAAFWKDTKKVIITLGTAWCFEHVGSGETVSNCLKIDAKQFRRRRLGVQETVAVLSSMMGRNPGKEFIFTVSPIRHLKDGTHGNQLSKSTLLLAVDEILQMFPDRSDYFPAYEIVLDELRDYRFFADDLVHPSPLAESCIWSRFLDFALPADEREEVIRREKENRRSAHREMHP